MFNSIHGRGRSIIPVIGAHGQKSSLAALRVSILVASMLAAFSVVRGQISPPIGPETYHSDQHQIGVGILTGLVKTTVQQIVTDVNSDLNNRGSSLRIHALPFKFYPPYRIASQLTNRPNEWYVKLPIIFGINVDIPVVADRQIWYPLDLNISCAGWETGNGVVRVVASPGPPSVEGGNIIEDVLHIRDYIDSQVKSHLPQLAAVSQTIPNSKCVTIGASPNTGAFDPFAFIAWDAPTRRPLGGAAAIPRLEITFMRLKRLRARSFGGGVLYNPTENIRLDVYANFGERQSGVLTMREDDDVPLNIPAVVFNTPLLDSLVVIANINQEPQGSTQDSAFAASIRSANYSAGTHTLQIPKHYVVPVGPGNRKPYIATTPAYELTYKVNFVNAGVLSSPN